MQQHLPSAPLWPLAISAAIVTISLVLIVLSESRLIRDVAYLVAIVFSVATMVWAVVVHAPTRLRTWALLTTALVVTVPGQILNFLVARSVLGPSAESWADICFLIGYILAVGAIVSMIRSQSGPHDRIAIIDAAIFVTGAAILAWTFVIRPVATQADGALILGSPILWNSVYVALDLFLVFLLARLAFAPSDASPTKALVVASIGTLLVSDLVFLALGAPDVAPTPLRLGWIMMYVFAAAAACHPSMHAFADPPDRVTTKDRTRSGLFALTLIGPVAFAVQSFRNHQYEHAAVLFVLVAALLLVFYRIDRTVRLLDTARRRAEGAARESARLSEEVKGREEKFRSLIADAADGIVVVDADASITYASPAMEEILGVSSDGLVDRAGLDMVVEEDLPKAMATLSDVLSEPGRRIEMELRVHHSDGSVRWISMTATNLLHLPSIEGIVANCRDVTERHVLEEELRRQAFYDGLTGLANRALIRDRAEHALRHARRTKVLTGVIVIDIDDFKNVNDTLGHDVGDALLTEFARLAGTTIREGDTLARLGGDEFAILLEGLSGPDEVNLVTERLLEVLEMPLNVRGKELLLKASIGAAVDRGGNVEGLFRDADIAMYESKRDGKNSVRYFVPEMHSRAVEELKLRSDLLGAVGRGEFTVVYQPQVDLRGGQIVGVEALVRWNHPERGLVMPLEFIRLAEESGEIVKIGEWVLRQAADQVARWSDLSGLPLSASVNVSPRQLRDDSLAGVVLDVLRSSGIPPGRLVLEITESALVEADEVISAALDGLLATGVRLAIDDFGTGYSSLGRLKQLPVSILKIDKAFVASISEGPEDSAIARAIVHLAEAMAITTVAEGLETRAQVDALMDLGCERGQGDFFSRPVDARSFEELLDIGAVAAI